MYQETDKIGNSSVAFEILSDDFLSHVYVKN